MMPVTVVAVLRCQPGSEAVVRPELLRLLAPTRAEKGCLNYDLFEDPKDPGLFIFHENWECDGDLDQHLQSTHIQACLGVIQPLLASAEVHRLRQIDAR
ncbi:MAG: antibiotic biosynthesis monooxygenase [Verrucomicrobia bacterium]|nr:antibiotic biosynthesis monooxygenase [Verrucomicrobiota bacterium]